MILDLKVSFVKDNNKVEYQFGTYIKRNKKPIQLYKPARDIIVIKRSISEIVDMLEGIYATCRG